ncbi:MAG TPA: molybdopterin-dependent oxidoreductase [bacterium]|nr:molybdopterin-dependent oxidoreductase [bacterium]
MKRIGKHPAFVIRGQEPFNAGPPLGLLHQTFVTPEELFFVRNHGTVPSVDPGRYRFTLTGLVKRPLSMSLAELRDTHTPTTVTATVQCAGNRRSEFSAIRPIPGEIPWGAEAAGNAIWRGVALRDLLSTAGVLADARHVAFLGLDEVEREGRTFGFGGSIPIQKAISQEVLLAYSMNDAPLAPLHGFPLRVVVPGYIGARSVKWLAEIVVQAAPSTNHFQSHAYKLFPPQVGAAEADWADGLMLGEVPVNAVICQPVDGERVPAGRIVVRGYALAGGGRSIERVDLSIDKGATWTTADLLGNSHPWAWRLWEAEVTVAPGPCQIVVRAWDSAAQTQPEDVGAIWNWKGYVNNAWHRVEVRVAPPAGS